MNHHIGAVDVLFQPPQGTCMPPQDALAEMDAAGIAVAMVTQCKQWSCERQWLCVDTRLEDVTRFIDHSIRFAGLSGYNPFDATESLREMEAARALGFRGAYVNTASFGLRMSDARLYPMFAKSSELGQPALVQIPLAEPDLERCVQRICRDFPELSLALVHPRPSAALFALCDGFDRLAYVLDTAALAWVQTSHPDFLQNSVWVERCLWGSNGAPLEPSIREVMKLDLALETLEKILRGNALRYFASAAPSRSPQALSNVETIAER